MLDASYIGLIDGLGFYNLQCFDLPNLEVVLLERELIEFRFFLDSINKSLSSFFYTFIFAFISRRILVSRSCYEGAPHSTHRCQ